MRVTWFRVNELSISRRRFVVQIMKWDERKRASTENYRGRNRSKKEQKYLRKLWKTARARARISKRIKCGMRRRRRRQCMLRAPTSTIRRKRKWFNPKSAFELLRVDFVDEKKSANKSVLLFSISFVVSSITRLFANRSFQLWSTMKNRFVRECVRVFFLLFSAVAIVVTR